MYQIPEKLKNLEIYQPVTESYRVRLDANESFLDLPDSIRKEVAEAVAAIEFNRYPDPTAKELCEKFGAFYQVKPEFLTAGNGSDELISIITQNFLDKGDTVLTVMPDFSMYGFYAKCVGAKVAAIQKEEDMAVSAEDMIRQAKETGAKMIIFSNPCNPTSLLADRNDILTVIEQVDALVVVDEAYMEFAEGSVLDEIEKYDNLIVLKTFSKAFGMAAVRLGFAAANKTLTSILKAVKSPYNVNSMTQAAGCVILNHPEYLRDCIEKIRCSRTDLYKKIMKLAATKTEIRKVYATCANFVYMKTERAGEIFDGLRKKGISIRYMSGYLRAAAGSEQENEELMQALGELLK